ncbi:ABC transporter permease [Extibacter muris]|uniref:ABC transporter permease n=1 Tax=Extibacter muris TaxID=1796622 RepID=UPI001D084F1A|nr:ABC transporter permease [Extibacter muris]MCB6201984.1 ABC transporter permease [Extibacter muris]MCQ4663343.1 ABC transporter permease [Extibacter muris]MCQ4692617.1 ABC transporter permease [Extibacter muris]
MKKVLQDANWKNIRSKYGMLLVFAAVVLMFSLLNPGFMTVSNWSRILIGQAVIGSVALGAIFILVIGEFDMSLGYMTAFTLMVGGYLSEKGCQAMVVIGAMFLAGMLAGLLNGCLIVLLKIPNAVATMGTGICMYGLTLAMSGGRVLALNIPGIVVDMCNSRLLNIALPVYLLAILMAIVYFVLEFTPFGKKLYCIGGNERTAYLSGVNTRWYRIAAFMAAGLFVALGALFILGQARAANPQRGPEYLMSAYATVYLSVTVFRPGTFNLRGVVLSLLLLGAGFKGLSLVGMPYWFENVFYGIVLATAMLTANKETRAIKAG